MNKIEEILGEILAKADNADKQRLAQAIEDFVEAQPVAWRKFNAGPLADLLDVIVEETDARPGLAAELRKLERKR